METQCLSFEVIATDLKSKARRGRLVTPHGKIETPAFMPVATLGTVKGVNPRDMKEIGIQVIISNIYHLYLRPGIEIIEGAGGIHRFIGWNSPIFVDSGGFQILSLSPLREITKEGTFFKSHLDGKRHLFTPELVVEIEDRIGVDCGMVLDVCPSYTQEKKEIERDVSITIQWAKRSRKRWKELVEEGRTPPALMGIVQGGVYPDIRERCIEEVMENDFEGYAIGGLSVGEPMESTFYIVELCANRLPREKPLYLMGMGTQMDIVKAVSCGVDIFDCVLPTRIARNGLLLAPWGRIAIKNNRYRDDPLPPVPDCTCYTCRNFSRAYLRHLFTSREILSSCLNTIHNLHFYIDLMKRIRESIENGTFSTLKEEILSRELTEDEEE